ncbi:MULTISPECIES: YlbF family regulator [unclassified Enterococcus]|uniref:YlbF family regulator n=1 Tax=unclassified Enterococcus TaxID=2608891 RepID=UPI0013ECB115|nr:MULTISPECIES: YlbF family regulator [unclassified Enterococcus]
MQQEPEIQKEVDKLAQLLSENETIIRYKKLEEKVHRSQYLEQLMEEIRQAQKDAVRFAHYGKKAAEQEAIVRADELKQTFDQHPLVQAYREQLIEANDLLHHLTEMIQSEINESIEEENYASEN